MICARAKAAIELSALSLSQMGESIIFVLLTLPGGGVGLGVRDYSILFSKFMRLWRASGSRPADGLRVWERHQSGGWHAHILIPESAFDAVASARTSWIAVGGGIVFSRSVPSRDSRKVALYLANELSKSRQKDMTDQDRRVRAWASWGGSMTRSGCVSLGSPVGDLLRLWGPLRAGRHFLVLCKLRRLAKAGCLPPPGTRPLSQWRVVRKNRSRISLSPRGILIADFEKKENKMKIMAKCVFIGQTVMSYTKRSIQPGGKLLEVINYSLQLTLETEDQTTFVAKMRLPPDIDAKSVKPVAVKYSAVLVEICDIRCWNDNAEISVASVQPFK